MIHSSSLPSVNVARIEHDLYKVAEFGNLGENKGVTRQGFTDADMQSRRWLIEYFTQHGLRTEMDGAGNVIGRYGPSTGPALAVGSHLDSVPSGGIFDEVLGVMAGLECVRIINERNIPLKYPIEIIATSEEEGRFGGMLGSQALTGSVSLNWLETARDPDGLFLKDAMAAQGLDYHQVMHCRRPPESWIAFLELHIEQGPILEAEQKTIGIVEGISGVFKWQVSLIGQAAHAGTAPMHLRSDAFMGLADFAHEMDRILDEEGTDKSRLTVGRVELKPGFPHTVAGQADFTLVGRDMEESVMENIAESCRKVLSAIARKRKLMFEYRQMSWLAPKPCHVGLRETIKTITESAGYSYKEMPSGAGHDAQFFADIIPSAILFVPSLKGISHAPEEWTHWNDVEKGANVLLRTILALAG
jgi:N-carbamoyl-L-amino-acid hydrolase